MTDLYLLMIRESYDGLTTPFSLGTYLFHKHHPAINRTICQQDRNGEV
ncbi:MAG: hypothetical protein WCJ47_10255 [Methanomicrobiales archaeon]